MDLIDVRFDECYKNDPRIKKYIFKDDHMIVDTQYTQFQAILLDPGKHYSEH